MLNISIEVKKYLIYPLMPAIVFFLTYGWLWDPRSAVEQGLPFGHVLWEINIRDNTFFDQLLDLVFVVAQRK